MNSPTPPTSPFDREPPLLRAFLTACLVPTLPMLAALHGAFPRDGAFLYVLVGVLLYGLTVGCAAVLALPVGLYLHRRHRLNAVVSASIGFLAGSVAPFLIFWGVRLWDELNLATAGLGAVAGLVFWWMTRRAKPSPIAAAPSFDEATEIEHSKTEPTALEGSGDGVKSLDGHTRATLKQ